MISNPWSAVNKAPQFLNSLKACQARHRQASRVEVFNVNGVLCLAPVMTFILGQLSVLFPGIVGHGPAANFQYYTV